MIVCTNTLEEFVEPFTSESPEAVNWTVSSNLIKYMCNVMKIRLDAVLVYLYDIQQIIRNSKDRCIILTFRNPCRYSLRSFSARGRSTVRIERPRIIFRAVASFRKLAASSGCILGGCGLFLGVLSASVDVPFTMHWRRCRSSASHLVVRFLKSAWTTGSHSLQIRGICR